MRKGLHHSLETRRKMSKNNEHYWKGKTRSVETWRKKGSRLAEEETDGCFHINLHKLL